VFLRNVLRLLVTAEVVPSSLILFTLKMEGMRSSEMSAFARTALCHIPEDGLLHTAVKTSNLAWIYLLR
jgi:hypothetical protein